MAKKKKATSKRTPAVPAVALAGGAAYVWRFIDYQARWGSPGGDSIEVPKFIKWYINGWSGCEGDVVSALAQLRADPEFIWLQGALVELLTRATNTSPKFQGYILKGNHEPASDTDVGRILRIKGRGRNMTARGVLRKLATAGFLERVELPGSTSPSAGKSPKSGKDGKGRNRPARKGGKQAKKPAGRAKNERGVLKGEGKCLLAQAKEREVRSIQPGARRAELISQMDAMLQGSDDVAETAPFPTSSTNSDESQRAQEGSPGRMPAGPSIATTVGKVLALSKHRYNGEAWQFADDVLVRSGFFTVADVDAVRRDGGRFSPPVENERAHWAKAWDDAAGEFGSDSLDWLRQSVFKRADAVRARRSAYEVPEAYLMRAWFNLAKDVRRKKGKAGVG